MVECICGKCGNKWLLHNANATCDQCPYCGHAQVTKRLREPAAPGGIETAPPRQTEITTAGPKACPRCGRPLAPQAPRCIYCGMEAPAAAARNASPTDTTIAVTAVRPAATALPTTRPVARPMLETLPAMPSGAAGGGRLTKGLLLLLLIGGAVAGVWYATRWHPNFTLAVERREGAGQGEPTTFTYKLKAGDLIRTTARVDMKLKAGDEKNGERISVSLDYGQFTRVLEVLPSGDYLTRTTARFVGGEADGPFDMTAAAEALSNVAIEAEIDPHGWVRPGSLADLGADNAGAGFDNGGAILRPLPRVPMAVGQVVEALKVVPMPEKPLQSISQFCALPRPSLTGDCLLKGIEVRNGRRLANLSIQALMVWEGSNDQAGVQFKGGVLWKGSVFYDIEAGIVAEVCLTGRIEMFAKAKGQGDVSLVGTIDYYDFSDLNPAGE